MDYGSHISLAQLSLPSLLEVTAQENLLATLQPAFLHLLQVVGGEVPWVGAVNRRCGLELFTLLHGLLQHYSLRTHGCSLSEHFYDLKRVDLRLLDAAEGKQQHLEQQQQQSSSSPASSSTKKEHRSSVAAPKDANHQLMSNAQHQRPPPPPSAAASAASSSSHNVSAVPSSSPSTVSTINTSHRSLTSTNTTPSGATQLPAQPPSSHSTSSTTTSSSSNSSSSSDSSLSPPLAHSSSSPVSPSVKHYTSTSSKLSFPSPPTLSPTAPKLSPELSAPSGALPGASKVLLAASKALPSLWSAPCHQQRLLTRLTALLMPRQSHHTRSLVVLVLLPYLHHKINRAYLEHCDEQHLPQQQQAGRLQRLRAALLQLWPYASAALGLLNVAYYIRYLSSVSLACSLKHRLSGVTLRRSTQEEQEQEEQAGGSLSQRLAGGAPRLLMEGVEVGAFVLQFLDWWYSSDRGSAAAGAGGEGVPPPPPPLLQGVAGTASKGECPVCRQLCSQPTALSVSGYVFCYSCILPRLRTDQHCPVTGHPATAAQLIKLYQH